jgi:hypothetical protein
MFGFEIRCSVREMFGYVGKFEIMRREEDQSVEEKEIDFWYESFGFFLIL